MEHKPGYYFVQISENGQIEIVKNIGGVYGWRLACTSEEYTDFDFHWISPTPIELPTKAE